MMTVDINASKEVATTYPQQVSEGEAPGGKAFKIKVYPGGEEIVTGIVPSGKKWRYKITTTIIEEDA